MPLGAQLPTENKAAKAADSGLKRKEKLEVRYEGGEALGLVETLGMVPAIEAADKMLKAAEVELISYENIGSTLVTIMVKGDVAAVKAAVEAGTEAAAAIGKVTAHNVMPRPIKGVGDIVSVHDIDR